MGIIDPLSVGDRVRVLGSYDTLDTWVDDAPDGYLGEVESFIPGQNDRSAAVIKLDDEISVDLPRDNGRLRASGRYLVLELAYQGAKWGAAADRVHVELCQEHPEAKRWQDRLQGAWVESHAHYERVEGLAVPDSEQNDRRFPLEGRAAEEFRDACLYQDGGPDEDRWRVFYRHRETGERFVMEYSTPEGQGGGDPVLRRAAND